MPYLPPVNFDSIEAAVEYLKTELQTKIDANNTMALEAEETIAKADLLSKQESDLRAKCTELTRNITDLEQKRETIRQEVREHSKKTTERLDKERADFEAVRLKKREELVAKEGELNTRFDQLDQREAILNEREAMLEERKQELQEANELIITRQNNFDGQQARIDEIKSIHEKRMATDKAEIQKQNDELVEKTKFIDSQLADLDTKRQDFKNDYAEIAKDREQAQELVLLSQSRLNKIDKIEASLKERESRLNFRETTLKELDKELTARKIQLDDRTATMKSYN